jgi:hypothetical protein
LNMMSSPRFQKTVPQALPAEPWPVGCRHIENC